MAAGDVEGLGKFVTQTPRSRYVTEPWLGRSSTNNTKRRICIMKVIAETVRVFVQDRGENNV